MKRLLFLLLGLLCFAGTQAQTLRVASYICDSMVLQRDMPVRICGQAAPGKSVEVSFARHTVTAKADAAGYWCAQLPALKACRENRTMEIRSEDELRRIHAVLVGDLWLAGGQSNMGFKVQGLEASERLSLARDANYPALRIYSRANIVGGGKLLQTQDRPWSGAYGRKIYNWSAVAYLFARELHKAHGIPIGIVACAHGGSTAEAWISPEAFRADSTLEASVGKRYEGLNAKFKDPSTLHTAMLEAFRGLTLRGVIWYQGESNGYFPDKYRTLFTGLIADWRGFFEQEKLPFLFAQLPSYRVPGDKSGERWAWLRQAQLEVASSVPNTAMVVTTDCGDPENIHPKNKYPVAMRFAAAARNAVYGDNVVGTLLLPSEVSADGGDVHIPVGGMDAGLEVRDKASGFELRDQGGTWHPASLKIRGNLLIVSSKEVPRPTDVRYAWGNINRLTVYHKSGIPLPPFTLKVQPENR